MAYLRYFVFQVIRGIRMHFAKLVKGFSAGTYEIDRFPHRGVFTRFTLTCYNHFIAGTTATCSCNFLKKISFFRNWLKIFSLLSSDLWQGPAWPVSQLLQGQGQVQRQQVRQHDHSGMQNNCSLKTLNLFCCIDPDRSHRYPKRLQYFSYQCFGSLLVRIRIQLFSPWRIRIQSKKKFLFFVFFCFDFYIKNLKCPI